jgi:hypothetical protein
MVSNEHIGLNVLGFSRPSLQIVSSLPTVGQVYFYWAGLYLRKAIWAIGMCNFCTFIVTCQAVLICSKRPFDGSRMGRAMTTCRKLTAEITIFGPFRSRLFESLVEMKLERFEKKRNEIGTPMAGEPICRDTDPRRFRSLSTLDPPQSSDFVASTKAHRLPRRLSAHTAAVAEDESHRERRRVVVEPPVSPPQARLPPPQHRPPWPPPWAPTGASVVVVVRVDWPERRLAHRLPHQAGGHHRLSNSHRRYHRAGPRPHHRPPKPRS